MEVDGHVVVLGLMGAGKTSIGRRVAERLGRPLVDGDDELERRFDGRTAADIARDDGIDALHVLEEEIAVEALTSAEPAVVAPAASVCESSAVRQLLAATTTVWLTAPAAFLAAKAAEKPHRPLVGGDDDLAVLQGQLDVREPLILPVADLVIDVATVPKDAAAEQIVALLDR